MTVDRRVAHDAAALEQRGDRELGDAVRRLAYELDAASWVARRRIAESERRVTLRPAPDVMSRLSAELPVAQGVAVIRTLGEHADSLRAAGDPRSRSQLMADTLVMRVLGTERPTTLPTTTHVVVSDDVLFGRSEHAAHVDGFGPVPAELARELVKEASGAGLARLRRLYATPDAGDLVAADASTRFFGAALALLIDLRDQTCRTPWCDAPIRHHDHVVAAAEDGETSLVNGQGLCEACNYAKQVAGWRARPSPGDRHTVELTTRADSPTGRAPHHCPARRTCASTCTSRSSSWPSQGGYRRASEPTPTHSTPTRSPSHATQSPRAGAPALTCRVSGRGAEF